MPDDAAQHDHVRTHYAPRAADYLTSAVHAAGEDLDQIEAFVRHHRPARVLDIGCGGGHVAYRAAAATEGEVVAVDVTEAMLSLVAATAAARGLTNLTTQRTAAEHLPFPDGTFAMVLSRFSAHHWADLDAGLREAARVLTPGGHALIVDSIAPAAPALDTHLQTLELLRDASHVRNYTAAKWLAALGRAGLRVTGLTHRRLRMDFPVWTERTRTPPTQRAALHAVQQAASPRRPPPFRDRGRRQLDARLPGGGSDPALTNPDKRQSGRDGRFRFTTDRSAMQPAIAPPILYHNAGAVCAAKVRLVLAEKSIAYESRLLDFARNEQLAPAYLALNPEGVVPTLIHDGNVIVESTVIAEYLEESFPDPPLRPPGAAARAASRLWTRREDAIHAVVNTLTTVVLFRPDLLARSAAEREARFAGPPDPARRAKLRELVMDGLASPIVGDALIRLGRQLRDMQTALAAHPWLSGEGFGLADAGLVSFFTRLEMLSLNFLWAEAYPHVGGWLARCQARPSFAAAIASHIPQTAAEHYRQAGNAIANDLAHLNERIHRQAL